MAENTHISWAHHTNNLWWGCTEVGPGCDRCYARILAARWGYDEVWQQLGPRRHIDGFYKSMDRFQKLAYAAGENHRVFIGSMMDIFEKPMPLINSKHEKIAYYTTGDLRDQFFKEVSTGRWPNLMLLLLTKRPGNIPKYIPAEWLKHPPRNVMYGCSPQTEKDIEDLMSVPGKHFLSMEPLIRPWDITQKKINYSVPTRYDEGTGRGIEWTDPGDDFIGVDWVLCGGESGNTKDVRPMHPQWARDLRDQCAKAGIPFHFKQNGEYVSVSEVAGKGTHYKFTDGATVRKVGTKLAGHTLDGEVIQEFPEYHSWFLFSNPPFHKNEEARKAFGDYANACMLFGKETVDKNGGYDKFVKK